MDFVPGPRGRDRQPPRRPRLRLRGRLGPLRRRGRGRPRRATTSGARRPTPTGSGSATSRSSPRRRGRACSTSSPTRTWSRYWGGRRPAPSRDPRFHYEPAIEAIAETDVAVEVSTAGLRKPVGELYPAPAFAEMCVDAGAAFALSSDAHVPEHIGYDYDERGQGDARLGRRRDRGVRGPRAQDGGARMTSRVGIGYDSHRFAAGRRLVLGGVEIEHELGSRATPTPTLVAHAITDAVLGRRRAGRHRIALPARRRALARRRLDRPAADRGGDGPRARRERRRDRDLRGAAPGRAPAGDGAPPERCGRRAGERQGDHATRAWAGSGAARASPASRSRCSRRTDVSRSWVAV